MTYSLQIRLPSNYFLAANYIDMFSRKASFLRGDYIIDDITLDQNSINSMIIKTDDKELAESFVGLSAEVKRFIDINDTEGYCNNLEDSTMN